MNNILKQIVDFKRKEIAKIKSEVSLEKLIKSPIFKRTPLSLSEVFKEEGASGIIAEFKRQSPSKGIINNKSSVEEVTKGYLDAGAVAQSVLTDTRYFGGTVVDLMSARKVNTSLPILRKDFVVDGFQIVESKAIGADAILLIATYLKEEELKNYGNLATDLGMSVLYEIRSKEELDKISDLDGKIIGINNRDLKTFKVDLENSIKIVSEIPDSCVKICESGISDPRIIKSFREYGFQGFLVGESFMKTDNPGLTCKYFIDQIR